MLPFSSAGRRLRDAMSTVVLSDFAQFGRLVKFDFMVVLEFHDNHVKVDVISSIPLVKGNVGLLLDFCHRIQVPKGQQIFLDQHYDISFSL